MEVLEYEPDSYNEKSLNGLIAENIQLLRKLMGSSLDDVYDEEFGQRYVEERAEEGERRGKGAEAGTSQDDRVRTKVLEDRAQELSKALHGKVEERKALTDTLEQNEKDAKLFKHRYDNLCSEFTDNSNHGLEHYSLLEKFNQLSAALRQAEDTNESLQAKIELREKVLRDADRINEAVVEREGEWGRKGEKDRNSSGSTSSMQTRSHLNQSMVSHSKDHPGDLAPGLVGDNRSSTVLRNGSAPSFKDYDPEKDHQFFFLADSAATALEMERLRLMLRKVGERLKDAEEERQVVSKSTAMLQLELDRAEEARKKVLLEIALAGKNDELSDAHVHPDGEDAGRPTWNDDYLKVPDLDAMKAESDRQDALRLQALQQQLEQRQQKKEEMMKKAKEWKEQLVQEESKREQLAMQWKKDQKEREEKLREAAKLREEEMRRYEKRKEELDRVEAKLKEAQALRQEELKREERRQEEIKREEILRTFVDSITPEKDVFNVGGDGTPERLISLSPDSDFSFPATVEKTHSHSAVGTPASERHIEGISTDLANKILSKTSGSRIGTPGLSPSPSPSSVHTPSPEDAIRTPSPSVRHLKVSPVTRLKVPKNLKREQIVARLEEIELRRSSAFESLSLDDVHRIAEEELEEKVLRRRLKKLNRRAHRS